MNKSQRLVCLLFSLIICFSTAIPMAAYADSAIPSDFNLQVTPSPLVTTLKPGTKNQLELKIHNGGSGTENLKIEARAFAISSNSDSIKLLDTTPPDIGSWISFSAPKFTIPSGVWFTEAINLTIPKSAGFSYGFALVISRQSDPTPTSAGRLIKGSLADFALINIDRPGATSSLQVSKFIASKSLYQYLPASFSVTFRDNGNTIAQPSGNLFIERSGSKVPISTLTVNGSKGYVLPGTTRTMTTTWNDGFPVYQTHTNPDGTTSQKLVWNWAQLSHLRIGRYTANLVAVYSQAGRDVPIEGTVSFWVIPWKILLALLVVILLILFALFVLIRAIVRLIRRKLGKRKKSAPAPPATPEA